MLDSNEYRHHFVGTVAPFNLRQILVMQIENFNKPFLDSLSKFDDGRDLSDYDFEQDGFGPPKDDVNKRKLAYRLRAAACVYEKVFVYNIFLVPQHPH